MKLRIILVSTTTKKTCEWLCDSERERFCVCVCVRESFRIHSSIFNVSCCTSVAMYQNAVTWHALLYIKKRKEKKEQAASCPVVLYKCWFILEGGGENLSLVTVSSTASTETHHLRSPKRHYFLLVNLIRLLMFQKECQFFCISAKAVQQFAHIWLRLAGETGKAAGSNSVIMLCVSDAGTWRKRGQVETAEKLSAWGSETLRNTHFVNKNMVITTPSVWGRIAQCCPVQLWALGAGLKLYWI